MRLGNGWLTMCGVLYVSQTFQGAFGATSEKDAAEIQFLTGASLTQAIDKIKSNPAVNWTLPGLRSTKLTKRNDPICLNVYLCNQAYIASQLAITGITAATTALLQTQTTCC